MKKENTNPSKQNQLLSNLLTFEINYLVYLGDMVEFLLRRSLRFGRYAIRCGAFELQNDLKKSSYYIFAAAINLMFYESTQNIILLSVYCYLFF